MSALTRSALLSVLFAASLAWGDEGEIASYQVEIDAPSDIENLLERYLDLYRWRDEKKTTPESLQLLVDRTPQEAAALLHTQGYFSSKIKSRLEQNGGNYRAVVEVDPGPLTRVGKIDFQLIGAVTEDEAFYKRVLNRLEGGWALAEGDVFTQAAWSETKQRVVNRMLARRYLTAHVTKSEVSVDPASNRADITMVIDSGPAYVFGPVTIKGLQRYPERIVKNRIDLQEGGEYRRKELSDLQSDLQSMPQFGAAVVEAEPSAKPPYVAPVVINLQEVPLNKLALSLGYSTNTGPRAEAQYSYNNLLDRGWVGGIRAKLDGDEQEGELSIDFPQFKSGYSHRAYVNYTSSTVEGLDTETYKGGVSRTRKEDLIDRTMGIEYLRERRVNADGNLERPQALVAYYKWIRRDLDNRRDPKSGNILQLEGAGAVQGVATDESFVELYAQGVQYWKVGQADVAFFRLELGQNFTKDPTKVPTDYLFRAGGANSVRGYDYQSLGIISDGTTEPGRVLATATLEYQYAVYKDWRAAVFADYGDAADTWGSFDGQTGVGVGARWVSPVGVLGADLAYGIDAEQWRFYFSLGLTF
ncbi:autotransporter assembly complex protein TamA [Jeongeupia naejangsanensis]|uniref:Translocation and assembly module subunit TamA n=1 Tax=Jeongeupia naejangsanensis TaxID=613195 RepID=A0ABS2BGA1_9NEIS|nr:autotransporter assembly complex family protein [Jeongeupia naejangsanensis]MBM3114642.1 outer membrane protein assembly factor [Jeongeupia naejangsanensis]